MGVERHKHQDNALDHLSRWKVGALFMEAGTGKTRVAIDLLEDTPCDLCLWICPLRTIDNARAEFEKWGCRVPVRFVGVESIGMSNRIYSEVLEAVTSARCPAVVVDESLKIKNLNANRTRRILHLGTMVEYKLILNGTPLSKNLLDLYAQMQFLSPKILSMSYQQYKDTYCKYKRVTEFGPKGMYSREIITGYANIDHLMSLVRDYVFQAELSLDVSQRYHDVMAYVHPSTEETYHQIKTDFLQYESLCAWNNNIFLAMTQKMQHSYCCDPSKVEALRNILKEEQGSKVLVFCKYIASRELCERLFPQVRVLSYQKESMGLNLQQYNVIVFWDKTFDYALRLQASRRVYRIGQKEDCKYYDITCDLGLDKIIDNCIYHKMSLLEYFKSKSIDEISKDL